jgi:hypothetical protein
MKELWKSLFSRAGVLQRSKDQHICTPALLVRDNPFFCKWQVYCGGFGEKVENLAIVLLAIQIVRFL